MRDDGIRPVPTRTTARAITARNQRIRAGEKSFARRTPAPDSGQRQLSSLGHSDRYSRILRRMRLLRIAGQYFALRAEPVLRFVAVDISTLRIELIGALADF